jgi:hypothetical protein
MSESNIFSDYVSGPISLSEHYSSKYDKHIYVFGEKHEVVEQPCREWGIPDENVIPIHLFIESVVNMSDKTIDVFIEVEKLLKEEEYSDVQNPLIVGSDLHNIREYYKPYLTLHKTDPLGFGGLTRFHYTDVRNMYSTQYENLFLGLSETIQELNRQVEFYSDEVTVDILYHIMNIGNVFQLLEVKNDIWLRELVDFEEISGLKKQIDKISDRTIRSFFEKFLKKDRYPMIKFVKTEFEKILNILHEMQEELNEGVPISYSENRSELFTHTKTLTSLFLITQMDVYLMARIFKNPEFKNVLIYVGNFHAIRYREWLKNFGFDLIQETSSETKCINISTFKPFFNL